MSNNQKSLLPFNATKQERDLESTLLRTAILPVDIATVWDPHACPVERLPWLAWALSVDTWDSDWPESTKRSLIANSVQIHKTKGTVSAIERVMDALGVTAELREWFEYNGQPHTFRLTVWANANAVQGGTNAATAMDGDSGVVPDAEAILSPALYRTLQRSVDNVKPVRSHYDFRVGAQFGGELGFASHATTVSTVRILAEPELTIGFNATVLSSAAQIQNISYLRITMEAA